MAFSGYAGAPPQYSTGDPNMILTPSIPFMGPLPLLQDGLIVHINGKVLPKAGRFHINFSAGPALQGYDTLIHINPRFPPTNQIVRNSHLGNAWGAEERGGGFPMKRDQVFEMIVLVTNTHFKIAINGAHFCEYAHRTPKERGTHLVIEGDVVIHQIRYQPPYQASGMVPGQAPAFTHSPHAPQVAGYPTGTAMPPGGYHPPPAQPPSYPATVQPGYPPAQGYPPAKPTQVVHYPAQSAPQQPRSLPLPHKQPIQGGLAPGKVIKIHGMPRQNPDKFTINLRCKNNENVAFHFNPRFKAGRVVVRNAKLGGSWGTEERNQPKFPFTPGQQFQLAIFVESEWLKVRINNEDFTTFNHRKRQLQNIVTVEVHGDVELYSVQF